MLVYETHFFQMLVHKRMFHANTHITQAHNKHIKLIILKKYFNINF